LHEAIEPRIVSPGFVLTDVVSDVDATEERDAVKIRIPDLLADEVRNVVLEGRLGARTAPGADVETVADTAVSYETFERGWPVRGGEAVEAKVRFVTAAEAQEKPTPSVDGVVALASSFAPRSTRRLEARRGEYAEAREVMVLFQEAVSARGHDAVASAAEKIASRVADADAYWGSSAYRSSMRKGGSRGVLTRYQAEALDDLRSMGQAKTTAAQDRMADAFGAKRESTKRERSSRNTSPRLGRKRSKRW
jgi:Ca-activated chloride channel homolog